MFKLLGGCDCETGKRIQRGKTIIFGQRQGDQGPEALAAAHRRGMWKACVTAQSKRGRNQEKPETASVENYRSAGESRHGKLQQTVCLVVLTARQLCSLIY